MNTDELIQQLISGERFFDSGSNAHLAGGAVRDSLFGKPISDYDLFLNFPIGLAEDEMLLYVFSYSPEVRVVTMTKPYTPGFVEDGIRLIKTSKEYYKGNDFLSYRSEDGKLNVMLCRMQDDIKQRIRNFPVSISQIGIGLCEHGRGELVVGDAFKWSLENRRVLYHTNDKYAKKIMDKYEDWEWEQVLPVDKRLRMWGTPF